MGQKFGKRGKILKMGQKFEILEVRIMCLSFAHQVRVNLLPQNARHLYMTRARQLRVDTHDLPEASAASRKSKWGRVINPNPPAISTRLAPGSGPAPLGRHYKDRRGQVVKLIAILGLLLLHFSQ